MPRLLLLLGLLLLAARPAPAQGFADTPTPWAVPPERPRTPGDEGLNLAYAAFDGRGGGNEGHNWNCLDLNGDGRLDLLVLAHAQGDRSLAFARGPARYWQAHLGTAAGFAPTATEWALPPGSQWLDGKDQFESATPAALYMTTSRYEVPTHVATTDTSQHTWSLLDLNGDRRPDLVVFTEQQFRPGQLAGWASTFGSAAEPSWRVYLNTGSGFATTATPWALPPGGFVFHGVTHGFIHAGTSHSEWQGGYWNPATKGGQTWAVRDLDGDARPDLVVLAEDAGVGYRAFGPATNRHWRVYPNTGRGFARTPTTWHLPPGGYQWKKTGGDFGFSTLDYDGRHWGGRGCQTWTLRQMDGDALPDLVIFAELGADTIFHPFGTEGARHWRVYHNTGHGFQEPALAWPLPPGGRRYGRRHWSFYCAEVPSLPGAHQDYPEAEGQSPAAPGNQSWTMLDLNADGRQDLVVLAEEQRVGWRVFGWPQERYWRVYLSTGQGFGPAVKWHLPTGGLRDNQALPGFGAASMAALHIHWSNYSPVLGDQNWGVLDLDGDGRLELVVFDEYHQTAASVVPVARTGPHWQVYR